MVGDGKTFGLESGEGHNIAGVTEESESINWSSLSGLDSSYGSTTVGNDDWGDCKSGS